MATGSSMADHLWTTLLSPSGDLRCRNISLDTLPEHSPWPSRLLGSAEWTSITRTSRHSDNEYSTKWQTVLDAYSRQSFSTLSDALFFLLHINTAPVILFHQGESILLAENTPRFWHYLYSQILEIIGRYASPTDVIAELGCGWGRNLFYFLDCRACAAVLGGEYTESGRRLAMQVSHQYELPARFAPFDFNNPDPAFLHDLRGTVVFTHNAIEQIPYLSPDCMRQLVECEPKIVIHFEPVYEFRQNRTLLHLLWKRYTEVNDYNRNLWTLLKTLESEKRIVIEYTAINALGTHALNPGSFIVWRPLT